MANRLMPFILSDAHRCGNRRLIVSRIDQLEEKIKALELSLAKSEKIRKVLMERVERSIESSGSAYVLFENNILLQQKVQQRTEEELRRMNAFLNSIVENIPNMIFLKDARELGSSGSTARERICWVIPERTS